MLWATHSNLFLGVDYNSVHGQIKSDIEQRKMFLRVFAVAQRRDKRANLAEVSSRTVATSEGRQSEVGFRYWARMCREHGEKKMIVWTDSAPPAIVSTYLGESLTQYLDAFRKGAKTTPYAAATKEMSLGIAAIPKVSVPSEDRNRTSPVPYGG